MWGLWLFCICHHSVIRAQSAGMETPVDTMRLIQAIQLIEEQTDFKFYGKSEWLDQYVIRPQEVTNIREVLDHMLTRTTLSYFIDGQSVILTKDRNIISSPAIANFDKEPEDKSNVQDSYLFAKALQSQTTANLEEQLFEIGNQKSSEKNVESTIAGYVRERETGNPVEDAFIYIQDPLLQTTTNADGFYSIEVPNGEHVLMLQSLNMKNTQRKIFVLSSGKFDVDMEVDVIALNAVTVDADRDYNIKSPQMGVARISKEDVKIVPALLGERDILKVATTSAGIQFLGEGSAGLNIRGGKADQNLFLLDGAPIYNTNHFFGFFSVLNPEAIARLEVYKNGIPAQFGGRLSSVFDIHSKVPNKEKPSINAGIGPVTSNVLVELPLGEQGPSLMVGGRANYSSFVLDRVTDSPIGNNRVSFYDLIGKIHHQVNEKNEVSVTGYYSFDSFLLAADTLLSFSEFAYRNQLLSFNWKHIFNPSIQMTAILAHTRYDYDINYDELASQAFSVDAGVIETNFSVNFDYLANDKWNYRLGIEGKYHQVEPGEKQPLGSESLVNADEIDKERGLESVAYFSALFNPSTKMSVSAGLRYSVFSVLGPGTVFIYGEGASRNLSNRLDTLTFNKNDIIKTYHGPEWRISARYTLDASSSLKASVNRTRQNVHLLSNAASIAPNDNWRLSSEYIKPQIADQFSAGIYRNFYGKRLIEASAEVYFKTIQNLVDFKVGTDLQFNKALETGLLQGDGQSYGVELSLKKSEGWLSGWINYTYSRSLIRLSGNFPDEIVNGGAFFPTGFDKPHYINSLTNYKVSRRLTMSLNAVYATGVPATVPLGKWRFQETENIYYSERNSFRVPDYFRLDLGVNIEGSHKVSKPGHSSWTFSVYNFLGRDNVYSIFFEVKDGEVNAYQLTVFRNPIPTVTYNFSF